MIIHGILSEDMLLRNLGNPAVDEILSCLNILLTEQTAIDVYEYLNSLDGNPSVKEIVRKHLGEHVDMFMYARRMRGSEEMSIVARTFLVNFPSEMYMPHDDVPVDRIVEIFKDIIEHKNIISAKILPNAKSDYERFISLFNELSPTSEEIKRLKTNASRLYDPNSKTTFTGLSLLVQRMQDMEMMCLGYDYINETMKSGRSREAGFNFG